MPRNYSSDYINELREKNNENVDFTKKVFGIRNDFETKKHSRQKELINLRAKKQIEVLDKKDSNDAKRHARKISLMG